MKRNDEWTHLCGQSDFPNALCAMHVHTTNVTPHSTTPSSSFLHNSSTIDVCTTHGGNQ